MMKLKTVAVEFPKHCIEAQFALTGLPALFNLVHVVAAVEVEKNTLAFDAASIILALLLPDTEM